MLTTLPVIWNSNQFGGSGGSVFSFTTIQTDLGTAPVADSSTDTLTLTSSDGSVAITGNSSTDTVNFQVTLPTPGGSNTELQYNNGGSFGGISVAVYDGSDVLLTDRNVIFRDNGDPTKQAALECSAITTGTRRTYTLPDKNGTFTLLAFTTITTPAGTSPVADVAEDTLTLTSSGSTITVTGTAASDTINFDVTANGIGDSQLRQSAGLSVIGRSANTTGNVADITAGTDNFVLRRSGTSLAFGLLVNANIDSAAAIAYSKLATLNTGQILLGNGGTPTATTLGGDATVGATGTLTLGNNVVSNGKFRQSSGVSVVGRSANSTGDVADITAGSNGQFLARQSNALSFVTPASTDISDFTEAAQDAVGAMISSVDFQYTDATPLLSAKKTVEIKVFDDTTSLATGDGKFIWVVPSQFNNRIIIGVFATITTVSSSGTPTVQLHNLTDAVDILSTAITIDVSEFTSDTAATPPVINTANDDLATGDRIRIDVDVAGTGAKGLAVGIIIGV
jgi:hypothetical protein